MNTASLQRWSPYMLGVLRIVTGLLFLQHGTQKYLNIPPRVNNAPMPTLGTLPGIQGIIEVVGGLMIIFGLFTRPVAFILAGDMAVAYFMVHAPRGLFPISQGGNGGELAILFCFVFLYLFVAGAGALSVDDARRGGRA
jgi:putative oxidoreductase